MRPKRAQRLQQARTMPEQQIVLTRVFRRNPDVIAEVLFLANGVCQGCDQVAPFLCADGRPHLEVHHRQPLAEGGTDTVENAIALCPNGHRKRHYGASYSVHTECRPGEGLVPSPRRVSVRGQPILHRRGLVTDPVVPGNWPVTIVAAAIRPRLLSTDNVMVKDGPMLPYPH